MTFPIDESVTRMARAMMEAVEAVALIAGIDNIRHIETDAWRSRQTVRLHDGRGIHVRSVFEYGKAAIVVRIVTDWSEAPDLAPSDRSPSN